MPTPTLAQAAALFSDKEAEEIRAMLEARLDLPGLLWRDLRPGAINYVRDTRLPPVTWRKLPVAPPTWRSRLADMVEGVGSRLVLLADRLRYG